MFGLFKRNRSPQTQHRRPKPISCRLVPSKESDAAKSILSTSHDKQMAAKQVTIESMTRTDRAIQDKWAFTQLVQNLCNYKEGLTWRRVHRGYICSSKYHFVTHELLEEGKGGYYERWPWSVYDLSGKYRDTGPVPYEWKGPLYRATKQKPHGLQQWRCHDTKQDVPALKEGESVGLRPTGSSVTDHFAKNVTRNKRETAKHHGMKEFPVRHDNNIYVKTPIRSLFESDTSQPTLVFPPELAPPPSLFTSQADITMAELQLQYDSLDPQRRHAQETWAQQQLNLNISKFNGPSRQFSRARGGYRSSNLINLVTDELLAEGLGGFYVLNQHSGKDYAHPWEKANWLGPYYEVYESNPDRDYDLPKRVSEPKVGVMATLDVPKGSAGEKYGGGRGGGKGSASEKYRY